MTSVNGPLPTFAEIAGAELPDTLLQDGISIVPTLTGAGQQPEHDYLYWEFHEAGGRQAVRQGKWKGIRQGVKMDPDAPIELYDLSTDLHEDRNVAEQYPEVVEKIAAIMQSARTESEIFKF